MEDLPRKLNKREAGVTKKVMNWFAENYPHDVCVELKIGSKKPKPHQLAALKAIKEGRFQYKIPDMGRANPFDFIVLKEKSVHSIWAMYYPETKKLIVEDLNLGERRMWYL